MTPLDLDAIERAAKHFTRFEIDGVGRNLSIVVRKFGRQIEIAHGAQMFPEEVEMLTSMLNAVGPLITALREARGESERLRGLLLNVPVLCQSRPGVNTVFDAFMDDVNAELATKETR